MALKVVKPPESSNLSIPRGNLGTGPSSSSRCCSACSSSSCARPKSARSIRVWCHGVFKRLNAECAISVMLVISTRSGVGLVVFFWRGATRRGSIPDPGTVESARLDAWTFVTDKALLHYRGIPSGVSGPHQWWTRRKQWLGWILTTRHDTNY